MTEWREQTFLIPRKVKTEFTFFGMKRKHMLLVAPWAAAAGAVYLLGDHLRPSVQIGGPAVILGCGYLLFGWPGGEDDKTAWELIQRWWQHANRQRRFVYRKETIPWRTCDRSFPASSTGFPQASVSSFRRK